jgi:hypothetical protein
MKYRKKPIVIEAQQYTKRAFHVKGMCEALTCPTAPHVHTIHNNQFTPVELGDFIIPEPDGEHYYPCKPDIFEATYEAVVETVPLNVVLEEIARQPYQDTVLSAGLVKGHPVDTIYLELERKPEEPTTILLRRDEALAIVWLLSGTLWSDALRPQIVIRDGIEFCITCGTALGTEE